ncbi:MAG: hypothetical protein OXH68_17000 [Gammaproteobacteria bacterium]|nr:hypothetical protein [Gammaproteobacteria bacterium]
MPDADAFDPAADPAWRAVMAAKAAVEDASGGGDSVSRLAAAEVKMAAFVVQGFITETLRGATVEETLTVRNAAILTAQMAVARLAGDPRADSADAQAARAETLEQVLNVGEACLARAAAAERRAAVMQETVRLLRETLEAIQAADANGRGPEVH